MTKKIKIIIIDDGPVCEGIETSPSVSISMGGVALLRGGKRLEDGSDAVQQSITPIHVVLNTAHDRW